MKGSDRSLQSRTHDENHLFISYSLLAKAVQARALNFTLFPADKIRKTYWDNPSYFRGRLIMNVYLKWRRKCITNLF